MNRTVVASIHRFVLRDLRGYNAIVSMWGINIEIDRRHVKDF